MTGNEIDIQVIGQSGFVVENKRKYRMINQGIGNSDLTESVNSQKSASNLGATTKFVPLT